MGLDKRKTAAPPITQPPVASETTASTVPLTLGIFGAGLPDVISMGASAPISGGGPVRRHCDSIHAIVCYIGVEVESVRGCDRGLS